MEQFEEISLKRLLGILLEKISLIVAVTLIVGIVAFVYSETMVIPKYASSVSLYVNNDSTEDVASKILGSDITASQMLVDTYIVIIKSDTVMNQVAQKLVEMNIDGYNAEKLRNCITAGSVDGTEIFKVTITCTDAYHSYVIANVIADVSLDIIKNFVEASSVKVIDYAVEGRRVSPNIQNNTIFGFLLGLLLSCAYVVIKEVFDMKIKTEEDLEKWFNLPILGIIPEIGGVHTKKTNYYYYRKNYKDYEYRRRGEHKNGTEKTAGNELVSENKTNSK